MNDADTLGLLLLARPEEPALMAMLTDAIIEAKGVTREQADQSAARIRQDGRDAQELALAAGHLSDISELRGDIMRAIENSDAILSDCLFTVILVVGRSRPLTRTNPLDQPHHPWGSRTVTVGAGWVIDYARTLRLAQGQAD